MYAGEQVGLTVALIRTLPRRDALSMSFARPFRPVRAFVIALRAPSWCATTVTARWGSPRTVTLTRTVVRRRTTIRLRDKPIAHARTGAPGVEVRGVSGGVAATRAGGAAGVSGGPAGSMG